MPSIILISQVVLIHRNKTGSRATCYLYCIKVNQIVFYNMLKNLIPFEEFSVQLQIPQKVPVEQQSGLCTEPVLQLRLAVPSPEPGQQSSSPRACRQSLCLKRLCRLPAALRAAPAWSYMPFKHSFSLFLNPFFTFRLSMVMAAVFWKCQHYSVLLILKVKVFIFFQRKSAVFSGLELRCHIPKYVIGFIYW